MISSIALTQEPALAVQIKRSRRARRMSLRVSAIDGRITLTLPPHVPMRSAQAFLDEKQDWIRQAVEKCPAAVPVQIGAQLPIAGHLCPIVEGPGRAARLTHGVIEAPKHRTGAATLALIKQMARERLSTATARFASALGETHGRITLRDTRSRWGSCTSDGNVMYSWRLVLAPLDVLDYVAAHEVAHLRHMNHSPQFWAAVDQLYPGYDTPRHWLRTHGTSLHRYQFSASD